MQDGIEIPCFTSASGQLNHARSGFRNKKEKSAAFRAVHTLFPEQRLECGQAALGLAYLNLEPDYRFALPIDIRKAENDFQSVLKDYAALPDIQARANWYLGWIYTSLDPMPKKGRTYFHTIVRDFPEVPMNLSVPEPWVNIVYPDNISGKRQSPPLKYWAQVALLELVRHPGSGKEAMSAFNLLYDRFFTSTETGMALKILLADPEQAALVLKKARLYTKQKQDNPYLVRDITTLAGSCIP